MANSTFIGTVTVATPLRVRLDGSVSDAPAVDFVAGSPQVGDRVICTQIARKLYVTSYGATLAPSEITGAIKIWPVVTAPTGYLVCDGTNVSRTTYATLFAVLGTAYGVGDGSTTFGLPNLKGKVVVGVDPSDGDFSPVGDTGGAKTVAHTHTVVGSAHTHDVAGSAHTHTVAGSSHTHTGPNHTHTLSDAGQANYSIAAGGAELIRRVTAGTLFTANVSRTQTGVGASTATTQNSIGLAGSTDAGGTAATGATTPGNVTSNSTTPTDVTSGSTTPAGVTSGSTSASVVQPFMALYYIIKT